MRIFNLDPFNAYEGAEPDALANACGLIPHFLDNEEEKALDCFNRHYPFGTHELVGAEIKDGAMLYPNDPPLYPYMEVAHGNEMVYIYPHAFVAIVQPDGSSYVTRMD